jgi:pyruvate dehydrogenase E2 component (dihydrolipoamide acetyltransferase)
MSSEFRMPSLGADMTSGILTEWLVRPGQAVRRGDIVAVVETDKGAIEIEIFEEAVIAELLVGPDTEVAVGAPLARLAVPGAAIVEAAVPRPAEEPKPAPVVTAPAPPAAAHPAPPGAPTTIPSRRKVSPAARRHAREAGLDLAAVAATGHGGVVTVADVERALARAPARPAPARAAPSTPEAPVPPKPAPAGAATSPMRRAIGAAMSRSKREIPHYYLAQILDVEPALRWLEDRNRERPLAERLLPGVLLLKAVARAAVDTPALNGTWEDGAFHGIERVDLGVVLSLRGGGLAAPTITDAARRGIDELMATLRDVTQRARSGRLKSSELGAASITVSSLGDTGVDTLFPIIHPPQVAIVGFGGIVRRPWVVDDGLHVRRVVTATLAADHRASDGHVGARFLTALARALERPETL